MTSLCVCVALHRIISMRIILYNHVKEHLICSSYSMVASDRSDNLCMDLNNKLRVTHFSIESEMKAEKTTN